MTGFRQRGIELSDISGSPNVITNTSVIFTDGEKIKSKGSITGNMALEDWVVGQLDSLDNNISTTIQNVSGDLQDQIDVIETDVKDLSGDFTELDNYWNNINSASRLYGGCITANLDGTVNIAAGGGLVKSEEGDPEACPPTINSGQGSKLSLVTWNAVSNFALVDNAYNYIYIDHNGTVQNTTDFYAVSFTRAFTIGRAYRTGNDVVVRLCGTNGYNFNRRVQLFGEERFPVERAKGLLIGETGTRNISVTEGILWAELVNRFTVDAFDSSSGGTFTYWYRNGVGGWTTIATQTQINNTQWDNNSGTLQTLNPNRYGVHWVYVVHDSTVHVVFGQGNYLLAQAEAATVPPSIPGLLSSYASLVGKIIIQRDASVFTEVLSPFTQTFQATLVTQHNDLSGLQGGQADQYYHLNGAEYADYIGSTEVANISGNLQSQINGIIQESTTIIGGDGISSVESPIHTFTISVSGDYATNTLVQNVSGDLQDQIDNISTEATKKTITQNDHGFAIGEALRYNGTIWVRAQADSEANSESVGIVSAITSNTFEIVFSGYSEFAGKNFTAGTVYFLSPSVPGLITATEPASNGVISKPMLFALSQETGVVYNMRGELVTSVEVVTISDDQDISGSKTFLQQTQLTSVAYASNIVTNSVYDVVDTDYTILVDTENNNVQINLPANPTNGRRLKVKKIHPNNTVTINRNTRLIEGDATNISMTINMQSYTLEYNTILAGWYIT